VNPVSSAEAFAHLPTGATWLQFTLALVTEAGIDAPIDLEQVTEGIARS